MAARLTLLEWRQRVQGGPSDPFISVPGSAEFTPPLHPTPSPLPSHLRVGDGPVGTWGSVLILLGDTVPSPSPGPTVS